VVHVDPEAVQDLAKRMDAAVTPHLELAKSTLHEASGLTAGMFTSVTFTLASVHAVAVEFMEQELTTKLQDVQDFRTNLNATAKAWARTEEHNTIRPR
jgi:hypothetical protein